MIHAFEENQKYGFRDEAGNVIHECQFDAIQDFLHHDPILGSYHFGDGTAVAVQCGGKWGYLHLEDGHWISPCQWDGADCFAKGLAIVGRGGKYGLMDESGTLLAPCEYDDIFGNTETSPNWIRVGQNGMTGFLDRAGNTVIPCQWEYLWEFSEGLARVRQKDKWGYIDRKGEIVVPCRWDWALDFSEGLAPVRQSGKWGFIDKTGQEVLPCQWGSAQLFRNGMAKVSTAQCLILDDDNIRFPDSPWQLIDRTGRQLPWEALREYTEGYAVVEKDGKYGFVNKNGQQTIPCQWDGAKPFSEGLAAVCRDEKWGFINKEGNPVIPCQWECTESFRDGLALVRKDSRQYGYVDKEGNLLASRLWDYVYEFQEGFALVCDTDWGLMDTAGTLVHPCKETYDRIYKIAQSFRQEHKAARKAELQSVQLARSARKQWRQVQLSGKKWPMP